MRRLDVSVYCPGGFLVSLPFSNLAGAFGGNGGFDGFAATTLGSLLSKFRTAVVIGVLTKLGNGDGF